VPGCGSVTSSRQCVTSLVTRCSTSAVQNQIVILFESRFSLLAIRFEISESGDSVLRCGAVCVWFGIRFDSNLCSLILRCDVKCQVLPIIWTCTRGVQKVLQVDVLGEKLFNIDRPIKRTFSRTHVSFKRIWRHCNLWHHRAFYIGTSSQASTTDLSYSLFR